MYNIYVNQHPFIIAHENDDYSQFGDLKQARFTSPLKMLGYIEQLESGKSRGIVMLTDNTRHAFTIFKQFCDHIEAAGGLVFNSRGEVLMIKRNGRWDLPKGKLDEGETIEEAALREVEEECGISGLRIVEKLAVTYHTYFISRQRVIKSTYWFGMETASDVKLVPQLDEGITEAHWADPKKINLQTLDTFPSVKEILGTVKGHSGN
jgi:8-oxo-dGTP pyrophosphatase MutT (NUDIX family)